MNDIEIKACPFCGKQPRVEQGSRHPNGEWIQIPTVWCRPCAVSQEGDSDNEAIVRWNTRAGDRKSERLPNGKTKGSSAPSTLLADAIACEAERTANVLVYVLREQQQEGPTFGDDVKTMMPHIVEAMEFAADEAVKAANNDSTQTR